MKPLEKLGKEGAFSRALALSPTSVWLNNVLGDNPKFRISDWAPLNQEIYELRRKEVWDISAPITPPQSRDNLENKPNEVMYDRNLVKHKDHLILSHINVDLWNNAEWSGTGFLHLPDNSAEPLLGIIFGNYEVGKQIFQEWRQTIGEVDRFEELRISIIQNIEPNSPNYRVLISTEMNNVLKRRGKEGWGTSKILFMMARIHTMEPGPSALLS